GWGGGGVGGGGVAVGGRGPGGGGIGLPLGVARSTSGASRSMMDPLIRRLWELGTSAVMLSCPREEGAFLGDVKPRVLPPGRAQLVTRRRGNLLLQTAYVDVPESADAA